MRKRVLLLLILVLITMMPTYALSLTNPSDELELENTLLSNAAKLKEIVEQLQAKESKNTWAPNPEQIEKESGKLGILEYASHLETIVKSLNLGRVYTVPYIVHILN